MKVLIVGQLPVEVGGTYTTGVCNVVYELSLCKVDSLDLYVYSTNISSLNAYKLNNHTKYFGTELSVFEVLLKILCHPYITFKEWYKYWWVTKLSPVRCEFYRYNVERIVKHVRPDIIHVMNVTQMAPVYFVSKKYNIPTILTLHGIIWDNGKIETIARRNLLLPDYVTGLTPETVEDIAKLGFNKDKTFMVSNGVDTGKFYFDETARQSIRHELCINDDTTLFLTVGSLQKRKGQLSFCKLLTKFPASFKYRYLIIGEGPDKDTIELFIKKHELEGRVVIMDYISNTELYKYYSASDIYVHASFAEGQALSEVEAYTTDLKIALNIDIVGTVVTDTNNKSDYYLFDYDNFVVKAFIQWAQNRKKCRNTRRQLDWNTIMKQYISVYNRILNIEGPKI